MRKLDHIELSEGNNNIVSSKHCPLQESETTVNQFFADVPVCKHHKKGKRIVQTAMSRY